jgi:site-specific recombinase XerD
VNLLPRLSDSWLLAGDVSGHSERTLRARRELLAKLVWFLRRKGYAVCGTHELRAFFHYIKHGHTEPCGRWGSPRMTRPTSLGTLKTSYSILKPFFAFLVAEGEIPASPMERMPPPVDLPDQVQPFSDDQLTKLLAAARRPKNPRRDEAAIILRLLDTGLPASEPCTR